MAWFQRLRNVFQTARMQRDIERELSFHVAERVDELRESGMSKEDAERKARLQFGSFASHREETRDADLVSWLETRLRDLRFSARTLRKSPVFTLTVVLTLALGIGANSAVFSAIQAVLLRPLPFPEGDQLMELRQVTPKNSLSIVAPVRLEDWNRMNSTFHSISGYYTQNNSEVSGELPERLKQAYVAPRFLQVWGIAPAFGRDFSPQEEHYGGPEVVLISHRFWQRRFGGDPAAVGKQLRFGSSSVQIVGIMPASFLFHDRDVDLWSPSPMDAPFARSRELTWFFVIGRLKPDVSVSQAQADLSLVQTNLGRQFPKTDGDLRAVVVPLKESTVSGSRKSLWVLFGSVTVLLLIACTNIAALLLSRAAQRQQEIALRSSLGASRTSLVAQLMTECFLLAVVGAALGLALAAAAAKVFQVLAAKLPRIDEIVLDWRLVAYSLGCAVATTFLCGLYPALRGTRGNERGTLVKGGRSQVSGRSPIHLWLVGVQVSLAVALLISAGLLVRSFQELGRVSPGFDSSHVLMFHMSASWGETADMKRFYRTSQRILDELATVPGIEAASIAQSVPGTPGTYQRTLEIVEGRSDSDPKIAAESRYVSSRYLDTMQIPLVSGERCREEDNAGNNVVVNRSFANRYLPGSTAVGRHIKIEYSPTPQEIRGIVGDAREAGIDKAAPPTVYWCYGVATPGAVFLVRTHGTPMSMAETVRQKMRELEPRRSIYDVAPLNERINDAFAENRLRTVLLAFFAVTAVSLACIGIYGTLSYLVNVRRREIGLRLALGALRGQIVRHFLGQGLTVSCVACITGLGLAAVFTKLLSGMLYGVSTSDSITWVGAVFLVLAVTLIASLLPALRAARLDPMRVLREE